jgi:hypothetical protein
MSAGVVNPGAALAADVLVHLDAQLASARHLLDLVLQQGRAIRARDVDAVLARLGGIQAEVERRSHLEAARADLLTRAGEALGMPPSSVTMTELTTLMGLADAELARSRSAELTGLLGEVTREHGVNRALMRQELSFLAHLTRLVGGEPEGGYRPPNGAAPSPTAATGPAGGAARSHRLLDLQA